MENTDLIIDEKKLYETLVKYGRSKFDTKLNITDKRIIFEKKYGIFKKKYKIIDTININDIKVDNNKAQVKSNNLTIVIETKDKSYQFTCNSMNEVKKIKDKIIKLRDDSNILEKTSNKVVKFSKGVTKAVGAIGGAVASVGIAAVTINNNKKEIAKALKTVKNLFKK